MQHDTQHDQHDHHDEIHMPPPSIRPIILAFGATLIPFGLVTSGWISLLGVLIFIYGLGGWIYDDIVEARAAEQQH